VPKSYVHRSTSTTAEVVIWNGHNHEELQDFMGDKLLVKFQYATSLDLQAAFVKINGGWRVVRVGRAVVKHDGTNRVSVLRQATLEQRYEEVHGGQ